MILMRRAKLSAIASPRSTSCWSEKISTSRETGWIAGGNGQFCCDTDETDRNGITESVSARREINQAFFLDHENALVQYTGLPSCTSMTTKSDPERFAA